jgi:hypothetical protein
MASKLKQNTMENLFELMEKYNLTLRRLGSEEVTTYSPIPDRELKENETLIDIIRKSDESKESFEKWQEKGYFNNCRWNNGFVISKAVREVKKREDGWLVKVDNSHGSIQNWNRKYDFYGKTPEEAIAKAVADIEKRKKECEEKKKQAGIC